jgi:hypothetical protein
MKHMTHSIQERLAAANWQQATEDLHSKGFALIPGILHDDECHQLIADYHQKELYRKTVVMERYRFGFGEYKYFSYPLPALIQQVRECVYPMLAPVANLWMDVLRIDQRFPPTHYELQERCRDKGQLLPTALILKYGKGGFNTLHQDLYGDVYFPMQSVLFLNEPEKDYTGGEFVLTEQVPRAQSKAIVLKPGKGDLLVFTTNFRPVKGSKGYYRANMKHGVSEVESGERHSLGIIFHDALS